MFRVQDILQSHTRTSVLHSSFTDGVIVNINSTAGLKLRVSFEPIYVAWVIQALESSSRAPSLTVNLTAGSSYQASFLWADATGYLQAATAYGKAANALATFSTSLGLGLAVAESLSLIADMTGLTATLLSTFSSISAITGVNAVQFGYTFSNSPAIAPNGSGCSMNYFESANPLSGSFNGNAYTFEAPLNYLNVTAILA